MTRWTTLVAACALLAFVAPLTAQQETTPAETIPADTTEAEAAAAEAEVAADEADAAAERADEAADDAEAAADQAEDAAEAAADAPTHDWEFALQPSDVAPAAAGTVMVTEGETGNGYVVEVTELPVIDSLDQEGRDVNAYTIWVVPSKDQLKESTLAGVLAVDPEGKGMFEGTTALDSFGIIVAATPDGAPADVMVIPQSGTMVLSGIPAQAPVDETPADTETPAAQPPVEAPSPGEPSTPPAGETPEPPETPEAGQTPEAGEAPAPEPEPVPDVPEASGI